MATTVRAGRSREMELWRRVAVGVLLVIVVGGLWYPPLGLVAVVMMLGLLGMAAFRGRYWCGHICPRGSFLDLILRYLSPTRVFPRFLRGLWARAGILILLMSALAWSLATLPIETAPDMPGGIYGLIGAVFVRLCLITTLGAIFLGMVSQERAWCAICPMGTMQNIIGRASAGRAQGRILTEAEKCRDCGICETTCPMDIAIREYLDRGEISDPDCIRCAACVIACPAEALATTRADDAGSERETDRQAQ